MPRIGQGRRAAPPRSPADTSCSLAKEASAIMEGRLEQTPAEVLLFGTGGRTQMRIEELTAPSISRSSREGPLLNSDGDYPVFR